MVEEYIQQYGHKKGQGPNAKASKAPKASAKASRNGAGTAASKNGTAKLLAKPKQKPGAGGKKRIKAGAR
jgi:hypothetical protein